MVDRERLVKLLNMTESQHDAEALTAIRRSNDLLRRSMTSWAELLTLPDQAEIAVQPPSQPEPRSAPRQKPPGWGSDLFGDEPTVPPPATKKDDRDKFKTVARTRIRSVPVVCRRLFFPIWAFAETYVTAVYRERFRIKLISITVPLVVGGIAGALWFAIAKTIVGALNS